MAVPILADDINIVYQPPSNALFPHTIDSFDREDVHPDNLFYSEPRWGPLPFGPAASLELEMYYAGLLPRHGRILDFCSSFSSHFPTELVQRAIDTIKNPRPQPTFLDLMRAGMNMEVQRAIDTDKSTQSRLDTSLEVIGVGMNMEELRRNPILKDRLVQDLNHRPEFRHALGFFDAATCAAGIEYLTSPLATLSSVLARLKVGGYVHLAISNPVHPSKVIAKWRASTPQDRLKMAADYLWFSGFRQVETIRLCHRLEHCDGRPGQDHVWVVRGRRP